MWAASSSSVDTSVGLYELTEQSMTAMMTLVHNLEDLLRSLLNFGWRYFGYWKDYSSNIISIVSLRCKYISISADAKIIIPAMITQTIYSLIPAPGFWVEGGRMHSPWPLKNTRREWKKWETDQSSVVLLISNRLSVLNTNSISSRSTSTQRGKKSHNFQFFFS